MKIQMLDLYAQYLKIKDEIDYSIQNVIRSSQFIKGKFVVDFEKNLADYLEVKHVVTCGNGTDALQLALMALELEEDDEIIVPAFCYVAPLEVVKFLGLKPVLVDVDKRTFNLSVSSIEKAITPKTRAIIAVHLFGHACEMQEIISLANQHDLFIIEDNAQSIGSKYYFNNDKSKHLGTIGHIGTTSFFPTKNLGCFGDGGALFTNDQNLGIKLNMLANHGQSSKYHHELVGMNSRLDALQAAVLNTKLKYLEDYHRKKQKIAQQYSEGLADLDSILIPQLPRYSDHVFHQYTIQVKENLRDSLKMYLKNARVDSMIYYPMPLNKQVAYKSDKENYFENTEKLCKSVLSLPIHIEMTEEEINYVIKSIHQYFE